MTEDLTVQDAATGAYNMRRLMQSMLRQSQKVDHDFFAACQEVVRMATSALVDHFSGLIQREMPAWSDREVDEFAASSGVHKELIYSWRERLKILLLARSALAQASSEVQQAEAEKSKVGGLFGAKKGREAEHQAASACLQRARAQQKECTRALDEATVQATRCAEVLLEECVDRAAQLADAAGYAVANRPRTILLDAAVHANELADKRRREQLELNRGIRHGLEALDQALRISHDR